MDFQHFTDRNQHPSAIQTIQTPVLSAFPGMIGNHPIPDSF